MTIDSKIIKLFIAFLGISFAMPCSGQTDDDRIVKTKILKDCKIESWQFSINTDVSKNVHYQMSSTLVPEAKKCVIDEVRAYIVDVASSANAI